MMGQENHGGEPSQRIAETVTFIRRKVSSTVPEVGIVLGSGLGGLVDAMTVDGAIPFSEIPQFPASTVSGHAGRLVLGTLGGVPIAVLQGRVHLYEGYPPSAVVFPARVLVGLGAKSVIVTNAAGALNPNFHPRELMVISDQLNLTGTSPLLGPNDAALGPRFPDMTEAFDLELRRFAHAAAETERLVLREGIYAGLLGPAYETPAEIRMLRAIGADAVGMSTVLEVIALRHMGARVLGLSCLSNMAAGMSKGSLSHDEVKAAADAVQADFIRLIRGVIIRIGRLSPA